MARKIHHEQLLQACTLEIKVNGTMLVQYTDQGNVRWQKHPGVKYLASVLSIKHFPDYKKQRNKWPGDVK